jgi:hypothetical protein
MSAKSLTQLANFYGTDKGTVGPSPKWEALNYTDIYEAYLARYRRSAISILEIGLGVTGNRWDARIVQGRNTGGASLKMWYDYFSNAHIYGIDVNECPYLNNDRIKTFVADQGNLDDLQAFTEATNGMEFNVIIDDGSHRPDHQQVSLNFFFKKLKSGGLYFIEDLLNNGLGDSAGGRHTSQSVMNTRSVLKHFQENGTFLEPNALTDSDYLKEQVAYINFHVLKPTVEVKLRARLRTPLKGTVHYQPETERLCAIEKK